MDNTSREIRELINLLNENTRLYDKGVPTMSDSEWDNYYFKLETLEKESGIIYPDSPTQSIQYQAVDGLIKTPHIGKPMLSLDKTKDPDVIQSFVKGHDWCAMFKMDGLTVRLTYDNGELIRAETRGNGEEGEYILHNALVIPSIPKTIPNKEFTIIEGEVICTWEDFNKYFTNEYKNPRNLASGSIRLLDSAECASRHLTFVAWDLVQGCEDIDFFFWRLEKLDDWGFITVPRVGDAETVSDAIEFLDDLEVKQLYPIDGYVFRFESKKYSESLGRTDHHWRYAMALKFYDEEYETELLDIEFSMGRTGVLTPIAIFKPIEIDGTIIERASLHNVSVMKETLGLYPDLYQPIWVYKANMIIPQISRAVKNNIPHDHIIFAYDQWIPCPCCGRPIEFIESDTGVVNAICGNPVCSGKLLNRLDHYLGKKGLDVKGISKATLEKLIAWGWINEIKDIYELEKYKTEWESKPGFGKTSVTKILKAISESKQHVDLKSFISAIGIPLVGGAIAKDIAFIYTTWSDFRNAVGGDWTEFEGFGPEINATINKFDYTEFDDIVNNYLSFETLENIIENIPSSTNIKDKVFCVTGKLQNYTRDSIKAEIESLGGKVTGSVTSKTNYLITNTPESGTQKNKDAQKLGVKIITEEQYLQMKV